MGWHELVEERVVVFDVFLAQAFEVRELALVSFFGVGRIEIYDDKH